MRHMLISRLLCGVSMVALATAEQREYARCGNGDPTGIFKRVDRTLKVTMAASAAVTVPFNMPRGASRLTVAADTATAFTGAPTNVNLTIGTTSGGGDVMAATDIHAQGHLSGVVAATFDNIGAFAAAPVTLYATLTAVGGTAVAGSVNVSLGYGVQDEGL